MKNVRDFRVVMVAFILGAIAGAGLAAQDRGLAVVARSVAGQDYQIGRQYAVLIAVDRYQKWTPLRNPVSDAKAVKSILQKRYYIDEFVELYDGDATAVGIRRLFADLIARTGPSDSVLIYYAGHGYTDQFKTGFWIPADGGTDVEAQDRWIPNQQIRNFVSQMKARSVALVADSCFSGDLLNVSRGAAPTLDAEYYKAALKYRARQVLTSGASETVPDESEFARQFRTVLESNTEVVLDPVAMYDRIRRGVTKTLPLLGTLPGQETGGSFALFLKGSGTGPVAQVTTPSGGFVAPRSMAGDAELMISLPKGVTAAEVLVNGSVVGKAPGIIQQVPSGTPLEVEVRSGYDSGRMQLTLKSGELREVSFSMARMKGNLYIESDVPDVDVYLDSVKVGALGSGLFRDIDAGDRVVELVGKGVWQKATITVEDNGTTRASLKLVPVGAVDMLVPPDASVIIKKDGAERAKVRGPSLVQNLPVGTYDVAVGGAGYVPLTRTLTVDKGKTARWQPYSTGTLAFALQPASATVLVDGAKVALSGGRYEAMPGKHTVTVSAQGYFDATETIDVGLGRLVPVSLGLQAFEPASVTIPTPAWGLVVYLDDTEAASVGSGNAPSGALELAVPSGRPVKLGVDVPFADSLDETGRDLLLEPGSAQVLPLPVGRFAVPWLPEGATFEFASARGQPVPLGRDGKGLVSPALAAGQYTVQLSGPYSYTGQVHILAGQTVELPDYKATLTAAMDARRLALATRHRAARGRKTAGWVTLGTGFLGSAVTATAWALGSQVFEDYSAAATTTDALALRDDLALYGTLAPVGLTTAVLGFGLTPILWSRGPDPATLQAAMDALDASLRELRGE